MNEEITFPRGEVVRRLLNLKDYMPEASSDVIELANFLRVFFIFFKRTKTDTREINTQDFVVISELAFRDLEKGVKGHPGLSRRSSKFYDNLRKNVPLIAEAIFDDQEGFAEEIKEIFFSISMGIKEE